MKNYSIDEKEQVLKEVKETGNVAIVAKKHKMPVTTIHSWLKKEQKKETKATSKSVKNLEKQLADRELEIKILKDLLKKRTRPGSKIRGM